MQNARTLSVKLGPTPNNLSTNLAFQNTAIIEVQVNNDLDKRQDN